MGTDPAPKRDVTDHRAPGRTGRGGWRTRPESTVAGLLLLAGLVAGVLSVVPVLEEPDFLRRLPTREGEVVSGALFQLLMVLAYAGFALVLHPVLHRASPALSLGFVSFRLVACGLHLIAIAALPLFLDLGRAFETVSATAGPAYEVLAETLRLGRDLVNHVAVIVALALGDSLLFVILHRWRLVPRWLAGWGLVGAGCTIAASVMLLVGAVEVVSVPYLALNAPAAIQTVVLAAWLIGRGLRDTPGTSKVAAWQHG